MVTHSPQQQPAHTLVAFLFSRRETLLNKWRTACEADPELPQLASLSRQEFNNLIPLLLEILEQQLLGKTPPDDALLTARLHGQHRWQKALGLAALIRELNHLATLLDQELHLFGQLYPQTNPAALLQAHTCISSLFRQVVLGSISKFDELQRLEASSRAASLQQALDRMNELSRQRGELLRTSSHDLRSGLGIIQGSAQMLSMEDVSPEARSQFQQMLTRNLANVQAMLGQLMDLARLDAGLEPFRIDAFDAAQLLHELVEGAQPLAAEQGIFLRAEGPASLLVETDRTKLYRIAQNLVINALKYTHSGIVSVSWSTENDWRWGFSVQDSGPGLPAGLVGLFHEQLKPTVEMTSVLSADEGAPTPVHPQDESSIPSGPTLDVLSRPGEGVGLQIVKRLCEQIGASLEVESIQGRGTLFRIRLLVHQPS
ncbi:sensor histidine kinase [Spirosoma rhododendri]|uniref:histidine kinase n=1 Tax=Spirosoma rhododendri TaxID=2728024 RepID=A0A7L5DYI8_9BACT|nr:HAMP domain-containing sensor histidine kinase [Spirosoma rhododendri]QJD81668.1 HAMP domain-containing histidine kinase [Spirosoma rhododendri]